MSDDALLIALVALPFLGSVAAGLFPANARNAEAWLAGGVVIVEAVFQYPGMGLELTHAVGARDLATVEVLALLIT